MDSVFASVRLDLIDILERFRPFSEAHAEKLGVAYTEYGRTVPILLRLNPDAPGRFILVHGRHRVSGARFAGLDEIDAEIRDLTEAEAHEVEVAENALRFELSALDRARSFAELARLYEERHPKNPGGRPTKNPGQNGQVFAARFSEEAQRAAGISERSIRRDMALARSLSREVIELLAGTPAANNAAQLKLLAAERPEDQLLIARVIAAGTVTNVRAARVHLKIASVTEQDPQEVLVTKVVNLVARSSARSRRRIAEHLVKKSPADAESAALLLAMWNAARPGARAFFLDRAGLAEGGDLAAGIAAERNADLLDGDAP